IQPSDISGSKCRFFSVQKLANKGIIIKTRYEIQRIAYPLALMVAVDQDGGMSHRLGEPGLIEWVIVVGGIFQVAFFDKSFPPVRQPEASLVQVLVVIKRTGTHDENEIVFFPATLEHTGADFPKGLDWTFVKRTVHGDVFGIIKYILKGFVPVVLVVPLVHITVAPTGIGLHFTIL